MRPLSAVERFFERLFERPSARLLGVAAHPVHLLRRVERAMEHGRRTDGRRTIAPDRFTIRLHPGDLRRLGPRADLPFELASGVLASARRHAYTLQARPSVEVVTGPAGRPGEVEVLARFSGRAGDSGTDAVELGGPEPASHAGEAGDPAPRERRPFMERLGMAAIALVLAMLFGGMAVASWIGGEGFLAVMAGIGAAMTAWAGMTTLLRG
jgi:hypothetical protein